MKTVTQEEKEVNSAGGEAPFQRFVDSLPLKPYCTDRLGSLRPLVKELAVKRRYIQPNSPTDLFWFVYDVDRPTAHFDWQDVRAPAPNFTVMNRENGHAHLLYGLEVPVYKQPQAHQAPLRYAASIDVAMTGKLQADPGYAGLICKNPLHSYWDVKTWQKYAYDLAELADYLDLKQYEDRRKHLPPIGLGRNCTMFDTTRFWAYRKIRDEDFFLNEDFFVYETTAYAGKRNGEFPVPLSFSEVKAAGKSVGRWTWRHMNREGFIDWCSRRGKAGNKKSQNVRTAKSAARGEEIRAYKLEHPEATTRQMGEIFNVNFSTISRALNE
jgi:hypothetical protein